MDRGAWRTTVHGVTKSRTRLKRLSMYLPRMHGVQGALLPQAPEPCQESSLSFLRSWVWKEALPLLQASQPFSPSMDLAFSELSSWEAG